MMNYEEGTIIVIGKVLKRVLQRKMKKMNRKERRENTERELSPYHSLEESG